MGNKDREIYIDGVAYWCSPWDVDYIAGRLTLDFDHQVTKRADWLTVTTVSDEGRVLPIEDETFANGVYKW